MSDVSVELSERHFEKQVKDVAALFRHEYYHTHRSQFSPAGFPDCVFVREGVIYAELKSAKGKLSEDQRRWLLALVRAGQRVYVWKPGNMDQILEVLR